MRTLKHVSAWSASLIILVAVLQGQERSDYQVVQGFKSKYQAIQKATEAAVTVEDCASITFGINELEREYSPYKQLLNKALYPDGLDKKISDARHRLLLTQDKLGVIEAQVLRIAELKAQVELLSDQVEKLSGENTGLLKQIQRLGAAKTRETIDSLQNLVGRLQSNIRQRDQLIFALVDSLFLQYEKDVASMKDVEKRGIAAKLEQGSVFGSIKKSIRDNIEFLETTELTGHDVAEVAKQQRKFEVQWHGLSKKMAAIYATNKKGMNEVTRIDTMLVQWRRKTDAIFWRQLNLQFRDKGYALREFRSGQEFYASLNDFIEEEVKNIRQHNDDVRYKRYIIFSDSVWGGDVRPNWIPLLVERGELSDSLQEELEERIDSWRKTVQPPQTIMYILIGLVLGLVAWFGYKRLQKGKSTPPAAQSAK